MEVSGCSIGIFYISKLLGLAPLGVRKNAKGVIAISRSWFFAVYSAGLSFVMVFLTYLGLLHDANSKNTVRASFRMKTATTKAVTTLDVSVVVMATVAGVICGIMGVNSSQNLNKRLQKIDDALHSFDNAKKDRVRAVIVLLVPLSFICFLLGYDFWVWFRFSQKMNTDSENAELNIEFYIPFYSLYVTLTVLHILFANTALGLSGRYRRLNLMLRSSCINEGDAKIEAQSKPKITAVKTFVQTSFPLNASLTKAASIDCLYNAGTAKKQGVLIRNLAEHHEALGKCMVIVSSSYGTAVLFILVSCLLHLVATAYFLFLELLSKKDSGYLWLQILWISFHIFRLLMVVEPCHMAAHESKKAIQILCEIERKNHDPILAEEIKKFWQQLLVSNSEYSAMGLCQIDRKILTSFSSAIATYLVILIQFQTTNN